VNDVHVNWPNDRYRAEFIRPLLRSAVRDAVSLFPVEEIYQERATIDEEIEQVVIPALEKEGFILEDILVRNVTFSDEYITAIELAQVAEVQIREQEFRVQQAEQEAEQVRVRAQGQADARVIQAQAEAQALQLVADVLAQNPQLIEYQYVQNLSDQVEVLALPSTSPYIFDLSNFINRPVSPDGN
jgi:regulator of protease activity HflC (stomatin/prohibitin superfamily)